MEMLKSIKVKQGDGSYKINLVFTCSVCGRKWFSKGGQVKKDLYHSPSYIVSPAKCPCYLIEEGKPEGGSNVKND